MDRRELLGVLGVGAFGIAATGGTARADREGHEHDEHVAMLGRCAKVCNEAARHCLGELKKGGEHQDHHAKAHEATMDCQAFCTLAAALTARSSRMSKYAYAACADACRDCAAACEGQQAEIMQACLKACRECEQMCRQLMKEGDRASGDR
ncbi:four-helix bundle copper-binding protein [Paludisphaera sp.]|uniref:four-helix bundle copper-binding protein n=1 Tax=Paludisphaera sp. TaxID=2017432 RepID=UPI00301BF080